MTAQAEVLVVFELPEAAATAATAAAAAAAAAINGGAATARAAVAWSVSVRVRASPSSDPLLEIGVEHDGASAALRSSGGDAVASTSTTTTTTSSSSSTSSSASSSSTSSSSSYYSATVTCTSSVGPQQSSDEVPLLPHERRLTLRLFLDNTIAETYWQQRGAMTMPFNATTAATTTASASSSTDGGSDGTGGGSGTRALTLEVAGLRANVTIWSVGSIWVTPDEVIAGARRARQACGGPGSNKGLVEAQERAA